MPKPTYGRPAKLDPEELEKLRDIVRAREALPSNAELARQYGCSPRTLTNHLRARGKRDPV